MPSLRSWVGYENKQNLKQIHLKEMRAVYSIQEKEKNNHSEQFVNSTLC